MITAHRIPYVAQTAANNPRDLMAKVEKALAVDGPAFMNILAPCNRGWRIPLEKSMSICDLAFDTCMWPLYEVENGKWTLTKKPKEKKAKKAIATNPTIIIKLNDTII